MGESLQDYIDGTLRGPLLVFTTSQAMDLSLMFIAKSDFQMRQETLGLKHDRTVRFSIAHDRALHAGSHDSSTWVKARQDHLRLVGSICARKRCIYEVWRELAEQSFY